MNLRQVTPITTNMQKDPILPTKIKTYRAKEDGKKKKKKNKSHDMRLFELMDYRGNIYLGFNDYIVTKLERHDKTRIWDIQSRYLN
jgi:hypothetical protein